MDDRVLQIQNRTCRVYGTVGAEYLLLQMADEHDPAGMEREAEALRRQTARPFLLVAVPVENWNDDLSPWSAPPAWGKQGFGGRAEDTLAWLEQAVPSIRRQYSIKEDAKVILGGYSLAGLFALWAATRTDTLYGVAAAVMLASVVLWFSSYNEVMTSDKFVYLFGRVIPALSLVLSMALRFIPKFKAQMQVVSEAQACIGRDTKNGSVFQRVGNAVKIFSIMVTWSLENAIETADSMRARGYGLPGRTAFSIYRFDDRDKNVLAWLIFCGAYILSGWLAGGMYFRYYPTVKTALWTPLTISFMFVYLALVLTPVILDRKEDRQWKSLQSET